MRFVVHGAGAIGGTVGGRLLQHGHDVVLVARGAHHAAMAARGLVLADPDGAVTLPVTVVETPEEAALEPGDVVLLCVKSQDTVQALDSLVRAAPEGVAVACLQNGVANERAAARRFADVYAVPVMLPSAHLEPGVVETYSTPVTGILDVGRYPTGVDERCLALAAAFASSTFSSEARGDVQRWKYAKLLLNLGNAVEALCGGDRRGGEIVQQLRAEGEACLHAAGIDVASPEEEQERRGDLLRLRPVGGARRGGGSSWQSLARGLGSIETDYLNGEVVLLGRLHGVPTPANEVLQRMARAAALAGEPPGQHTVDEVLARIEALRSSRPA